MPSQRCPICLSDEGLAEAAAAVTPQAACRSGASCCSSCSALFHRTCVANHALAAADRGHVLVRCPVPDCATPWPDDLLTWALEPEELERFRRAAGMNETLRAAASASRESLSPRSSHALELLGVKPCPRCQSLIQKQPEGLLTGCDKMTCRCGCMFCFKCGLEARAGGVARCRCVGMHHAFIPQSQVLSNYKGVGYFAQDEDLTKRSRGPPSKPTMARLRKELKSIAADPPLFIHVNCQGSDLLSWDFLIEGPPDTPYDGGWYWGELEIPKDYPFLPPLIRILTPSGRFQADRWLCRSVFDYHPEGWQPPWTLAGVLTALLALMCQESFTAGAVHPLPAIDRRRHLARTSLAWNRQQRKFARAFPDVDGLVAQAARQRSALGLGAAPAAEPLPPQEAGQVVLGADPAGRGERSP